MSKIIYTAVFALVVAVSAQAQDIRFQRPNPQANQLAVNRAIMSGYRLNPLQQAHLIAQIQRRNQLIRQQQAQYSGFRYDPKNDNTNPYIMW